MLPSSLSPGRDSSYTDCESALSSPYSSWRSRSRASSFHSSRKTSVKSPIPGRMLREIGHTSSISSFTSYESRGFPIGFEPSKDFNTTSECNNIVQHHNPETIETQGNLPERPSHFGDIKNKENITDGEDEHLICNTLDTNNCSENLLKCPDETTEINLSDNVPILTPEDGASLAQEGATSSCENLLGKKKPKLNTMSAMVSTGCGIIIDGSSSPAVDITCCSFV